MIICLGTSLTVNPAVNIVKLAVEKTEKSDLGIVNIQETPLDNLAQWRLGYFCDEVM